MRTIVEAVKSFQENKGDVKDFQNVIKTALIEEPSIKLPNDSFTYALAFIELMFLKAEKEIRIFTGNNFIFEYFIKALESSLSIALSRFKKRTDSFIRIILLNSKNDEHTKGFLDKLADKNIDIIKATYNDEEKKVGHFMCVDSNMYRIERPHPELTQDSDESVIKARVCFDDADVARLYIRRFDSIWNKLKGSK